VLVIHGGAGTIERNRLTPEQDAAYRAALDSALSIGYAILERNGSALDAVTAAVAWLEDCPLFNAGRGSVLNADGRVEMDAALVDGHTGLAGSVAGVCSARHPILLAREVMLNTPHVFLAGPSADTLAGRAGLECVSPDWLAAPERARERPNRNTHNRGGDGAYPPPFTDKMGTVGAVALDSQGHLAAATSTGGMAGKMPGRVGDAPVIGAGTYAADSAVAVSCTGHGEFFIRYGVAHDIAARVRYGRQPLRKAANAVVYGVLKPAGALGGLIALNAKGEWAWPHNTPGMFRAVRTSAGVRRVALYADEN
jgi:beta-aspartyl-peptidase (threonine type)